MNDLSKGERVFIIAGAEADMRIDGRKCLDYRRIELKTNVMGPTSNGSAMVQIGDTKVIAVVKAELAYPLPLNPNKGWIEVSIDCTVHAGLEFVGRRRNAVASDISKKLKEICNKFIDLEKLCIVPDVQVWVLYVDIMVIEYGGNWMDAAAIATKAALFNTKIQSTNVTYDNKNVLLIEISEDPYDTFTLDVTHLPCFLTLNRIGKAFIIDATKEEEVCSKAKLLLAVSAEDIVLMKEMSGPGSLHFQSICDIRKVGCEIGKKLLKQLNEILEENKTRDTCIFKIAAVKETVLKNK